MDRVAVASTNPVKLNAVRRGFARVFPDQQFEFILIPSQSGVSSQPMSDKETLQGALNRVEFVRQSAPEADFWVGLEGGAEEMDGRFFAFAWIVICGRDRMGKSRTASHELPDEICRLIRSGLELGDANDQFYNRKNSKQLNGSIGILTGDLYTRTTLYEQSVVFALIPFKNAEIYVRKSV